MYLKMERLKKKTYYENNKVGENYLGLYMLIFLSVKN